VVAALLAVAVWSDAPQVAMILLLVAAVVLFERVDIVSARREFGHFEPLPRAELAKLRRRARREWIGLAPWRDAGTLVGALGALGLLGAALFATTDWQAALACPLVTWIASARFLRPRTLAQRVDALARAAETLRLAGCALRLVWFVSPAGASEPRLRVVPARPFQGLLRLELVADSRRAVPPISLCVVVAADSSADRALRAAWGAAQRELSQAGRRAAYFRAGRDVEAELKQLLRGLSEGCQAVVAAAATARRAA
jgi:hypothetical protein